MGADLKVVGNSESSHSGEEWFEDRQTLHSSGHGEGEGDGEAIWLLSYADMMTLLFGFFVMVSSFSKIDLDNFDRVRRETTQVFGGEYKHVLLPFEKSLQEDFTETGTSDQAQAKEIDNGIALSFRGSLFFESASAEIKPAALELLAKVIESVKKQPVRFAIIVEGHTDDNSIKTEKFPSNWELSSHRASAVLRVFEEAGFDRGLLRAVGYADIHPVLPNRDPAGKPISGNQDYNRRVVIKLVRAAAVNKPVPQPQAKPQ